LVVLTQHLEQNLGLDLDVGDFLVFKAILCGEQLILRVRLDAEECSQTLIIEERALAIEIWETFDVHEEV